MNINKIYIIIKYLVIHFFNPNLKFNLTIQCLIYIFFKYNPLKTLVILVIFTSQQNSSTLIKTSRLNYTEFNRRKNKHNKHFNIKFYYDLIINKLLNG